MSEKSAPQYFFFQPGHALPLRWLRLPLLLATLGLSCVCIAVGAQALQKSDMLRKSIMEEAEMSGSTITFDMKDIQATTIVLTTVASLLALASLIFSTALAFDWLRHLLHPPKPNPTSKHAESEDEVTVLRRPVFSTRTLLCQTLTLAFLTLWLLTVLIPSTLFARTRSAHVMVQTASPGLASINPVYWDYGFLRCLAAAPWVTFIFSLPASVVSFVAWKAHFAACSRRAVQRGG